MENKQFLDVDNKEQEQEQENISSNSRGYIIAENNNTQEINLSQQENVYIDDDFVFPSSTTEFNTVSQEDTLDDNYAGMTPKRNHHYVHSDSKGFFSKHKIPIIITSAVLVVAIAVTTLFATGVFSDLFYHPAGSITNEQGEFTYLSDMYVSGIDISGKTYEEAKALLEESAKKFITPFNLKVTASEKPYDFTQDDFDYSYNIDEVLTSAKNYCLGVSDGSIEPVKPETDENGNPVDRYKIKATVTPDSINSVVDKIAKATDVDAVNAKVSKFTPYSENRFEYADGTVGKQTNRDDLNASITAFINTNKNSGSVTAKVEDIQPKITLDMVKQNIVPLAYYTTNAVADSNSVYNMGVALEACNGSVVEAHETWSFNETTGNSNLESNGYVSAGVISGGSMATGVGGGLCQASTTIYNAGIFANMEIIERSNHYWASTYVPAGFDATIDYPSLDLKMKNNTDYQMFIECRLDGRKLMCNIYGYQDPSYDDIKTYSENYNVVSGQSYNTRSFRILLKDGKEVHKEQLPSSYYSLTGGHSVRYADAGTHRVKPNESDTIDRPANTTLGENDNSSSSTNSTYSRNPESSSSSTGSSGSSSASSNTSSTLEPEEDPTVPPTAPPTEPPEEEQPVEPETNASVPLE